MKILSKLSNITLLLGASIIISGSGSGHRHHNVSYENKEDLELNRKLLNIKHKILEQKAELEEATNIFKSEINIPFEGTAKVHKLYFEDGNTYLFIKESPIPIKILFKGQYLLDNKLLTDKVGKVIKFRISNVDFIPEPINKTLRIPLTDSPYWIHLTFSNYGKGTNGDFVDNLKPDSIPY
ncbi:MAG: hypothetical protein KatS3mg068_2216 [Candidatus Sericytochromatia bacterium]|nr:MAG: hypothetical protein KatS3mg068_2216 [Candidatus Sericytochromatia bacterium]